MFAITCGGGPTAASAGRATIQIDGSSAIFPISEAVAEEFQRVNPNVRITEGVSGTGGGFQKFCCAETDLSDASRPFQPAEIAIQPAEIEACARTQASSISSCLWPTTVWRRGEPQESSGGRGDDAAPDQLPRGGTGCPSGIIAAYILAMSGAVGEMTIGCGRRATAADAPPTVPVETTTTYIVQVSLGDMAQGRLEYRTISAVGMLLGTSVNATSTWLRERSREHVQKGIQA